MSHSIDQTILLCLLPYGDNACFSWRLHGYNTLIISSSYCSLNFEIEWLKFRGKRNRTRYNSSAIRVRHFKSICIHSMMHFICNWIFKQMSLTCTITSYDKLFFLYPYAFKNIVMNYFSFRNYFAVQIILLLAVRLYTKCKCSPPSVSFPSSSMPRFFKIKC